MPMRKTVCALMSGCVAVMALAAPALACTTLRYFDAANRLYLGRTLELAAALPYQLVYFPAGQKFKSDEVSGHPSLNYQSRYAIFGIAFPDVSPGGKAKIALNDLKLIDGINEAGLSFALLAYPNVNGPQKQIEKTRAILAAVDLGTWTLGQFASAADVRQALARQPAMLAPIRALGGAEGPFHFIVYDRTGASIVIEFNKGKETVYENPVGVMTNGPQFSWHLTNLNNYTHLSNIDKSSGSFGGFKVKQPDSGISTAGLPASDTSVGRFVRAAFYSTYTQKAKTPDQAVRTLAHVMNNFDRPIGISINKSGGEGDTLDKGLGITGESEYTTWTRLADLERLRFFVRDYTALNYTMFELGKLRTTKKPAVIPLAAFIDKPDGTSAVMDAAGK
ncbi:hydrolase [Brucella endophytica]|uniref:Hydrolase n=1 Tax=Brucella endophytica TaxID=1963359 RepID=A0A916SEG4_9HYPH|nr:linear amide C-N hydrolase [Brucella endophytica]GGA93464.1 hydrolase [Brucella endophytica]